MAFPVIKCNDATGSDPPNASGAGPATPLTGTSASFTGSVVTLDGTPDLSGITDDEDVLFLNTTTGRKWFRITAHDDGADTVTVEDAPAGTASGLSWAIGGTLNNIGQTDTVLLFSADGMKGGWAMELEDDHTISAQITIDCVFDATGGSIFLRSDTPGTVRYITQSASAAVHFTIANSRVFDFAWIGFKNSHATKDYAIEQTGTAQINCSHCIFGDPADTDNILGSSNRTSGGNRWNFVDCAIINCTGDGINNSFQFLSLIDCYIAGNDGAGVELLSTASAGTFIAIGTIICNNTGSGIKVSSPSARANSIYLIKDCTIHNNGTTSGDGIDITKHESDNEGHFLSIIGNQITGNANGYGINIDAAAEGATHFRDYNNFGTGATANGSGAVPAGFSIGPNSTNLDPNYADAANDDYAIGTATKEGGFPDPTRTIGAGQSGTTSYKDVGAAQRQEPAVSNVYIPIHKSNSLITR